MYFPRAVRIFVCTFALRLCSTELFLGPEYVFPFTTFLLHPVYNIWNIIYGTEIPMHCYNPFCGSWRSYKFIFYEFLQPLLKIKTPLLTSKFVILIFMFLFFRMRNCRNRFTNFNFNFNIFYNSAPFKIPFHFITFLTIFRIAFNRS